jgi:hypothetical protein
MASATDIVQVTITREGPSITTKGFGVPLILGLHTAFAERFREYTDITGVLEDFLTSDPEFAKAQGLFDQQKIQRIKIGRRLTPVAQENNLTVQNLLNDTEYTVTIDGVAFSFTSDGTATDLEIIAGLETAINAGGLSLTLTNNGANLDILADNAGQSFIIQVDANLGLTLTTANVGIATDIQEISEINDDWYSLELTTNTVLDILEGAKAVQSRIKKFSALSRDADTITSVTTDIGSQLKALNFDRTHLIRITDGPSHPDAAWDGVNLPENPGAVTWKFSTLTGVLADKLTSNEISNAKGKNINVYIPRNGFDMTENGIMANGTPIDLIRTSDSIQAEITTAVFNLISQLLKIPFTDSGADQVRNEILAVLRNAQGDGRLSTDVEPIVFIPLVADVSATDKANRLLPDVTFTATFAGAIENVQIRGTISI